MDGWMGWVYGWMDGWMDVGMHAAPLEIKDKRQDNNFFYVG